MCRVMFECFKRHGMLPSTFWATSPGERLIIYAMLLQENEEKEG